jgi:DNA (cytosine-5)-methyltransferase 1
MASSGLIPVIDLFAGPGGLAEGFSECGRTRRNRAFKIAFSVEMEHHAHRTLRLRSFYRNYRYRGARLPEAFYKVLRGEISAEELEEWCPVAWAEADSEAIQAELGNPGDDEHIEQAIRQQKKSSNHGPLVLIGGPPCQAYSLVGRARNRGVSGYTPERDPRHQLYRQYLQIIAKTWPAVFVMENVKGILSSRVHQQRIFPRILDDLHDPGRALGGPNAWTRPSRRYRLVPVAVGTDMGSQVPLFDPQEDLSAFIIRCERYGVPQRRHRVFVVGLREDLRGDFVPPTEVQGQVTVRDVIGRMPRLRSEISRRCAAGGGWAESIRDGITPRLLRSIEQSAGGKVASLCENVAASVHRSRRSTGAEFLPADNISIDNAELDSWIIDPRLDGVCNHTSKTHMPADLIRYVFVASFGKVMGRSPVLADFPDELLPFHRNVSSRTKGTAVFNDRFRVQVWNEPATTITSHIAKDGHYFIHPDPKQCRSLTVREAGRLQTFPDNYFFCGPRNAQDRRTEGAVDCISPKMFCIECDTPYDLSDGKIQSMVA